MTLSTFTINGNEFHSYATLQEADAYLSLDLKRGTNWAGFTDEVKQQRLAAASRFLDELNWRGEAEDSTRSWPRRNITTQAGTPITGIPQALADATAVLAVNLSTETEDDADIKSHSVGAVRFDRFDNTRTTEKSEYLKTIRPLIGSFLILKLNTPTAYNADGEPFYESRNPFGRSEGIA